MAWAARWGAHLLQQPPWYGTQLAGVALTKFGLMVCFKPLQHSCWACRRGSPEKLCTLSAALSWGTMLLGSTEIENLMELGGPTCQSNGCRLRQTGAFSMVA